MKNESRCIGSKLITASLIAYDLQRPQNLGLYRLAFALMITEAAQRKALLNISAGVGNFKMLRGAVPVQEFDAVYDRHLPISRRLPWVGIRMAAGLGRLLFPRREGVRFQNLMPFSRAANYPRAGSPLAKFAR